MASSLRDAHRGIYNCKEIMSGTRWKIPKEKNEVEVR